MLPARTLTQEARVSTQADDHQPRRRPAGELAEIAWVRWCAMDRRVIAMLGRISLPGLRGSLGVVFGWFGVLKIAAVSPVADLVTAVLEVAWIDPSWAVPALGITDVTVGLGLLTGRGLRAVLALCTAQLIGTFLITGHPPGGGLPGRQPPPADHGGEFVLKNLVLLSAGLAVGARLRAQRPWSATPSPRP